MILLKDKMNKNKFVIQFTCFLFSLSLIPFFASAAFVGEKTNLYIDNGFSLNNRDQVSATFVSGSSLLDIYVDSSFWENKTEEEKKEIFDVFDSLSHEFDLKIYNQLTYTYGEVWDASFSNAGKKVTLLFHQMKENVNGYTRNIDGYEKTIVPYSNQREIIYLNTDKIESINLKSYLAHEFTHLIQFNQKEKKLGTPEEVWLNELRAEVAPTILGYNDVKEEKNYLRERVSTFLSNSSDSLIKWDNMSYDYGVVSMFGHYLFDHYGVDVLGDSLKNSNKVGIESIEEVLLKKGIQDTFKDIFTNWMIANYVNDCSLNSKYCYKNENLKSLQIIPFSNFISFTNDSSLSIGQTVSNWSANWQRFSGGNKDLKLVFDGRNNNFKVYYVIRYYTGKQEVKEIKLDNYGKAEIVFPKMGTSIASLVIIPSIQERNSSNQDFYYSIVASTQGSVENNNNTEIKLPFEIDKPLNQMNKEELLILLIRVIIYLLVQGKLVI
jgi:hypothetical protein